MNKDDNLDLELEGLSEYDRRVLMDMKQSFRDRRTAYRNDIVDKVLDEVLASDGKVRNEGLFSTPVSRIQYRNSIKQKLNDTYDYNLPLRTDDPDQIITELKQVLDEDDE